MVVVTVVFLVTFDVVDGLVIGIIIAVAIVGISVEGIASVVGTGLCLGMGKALKLRSF